MGCASPKLSGAERSEIYAATHSCRGILGDRSMTGRWGGSVLDSVIGAFLTQNASDVLSSKAWMTLQSRFPAVQSKTMECPAGQVKGVAAGSHQDMIDWEAVRLAPADQVTTWPSFPKPVCCGVLRCKALSLCGCRARALCTF